MNDDLEDIDNKTKKTLSNEWSIMKWKDEWTPEGAKNGSKAIRKKGKAKEEISLAWLMNEWKQRSCMKKDGREKEMNERKEGRRRKEGSKK